MACLGDRPLVRVKLHSNLLDQSRGGRSPRYVTEYAEGMVRLGSPIFWRGSTWALGGAAWSVFLLVGAVALPTQATQTGTSEGHRVISSTTLSTLVATQGLWPLVLLVIPLLLALLCGAALSVSHEHRSRRASEIAIICVALVFGECIVGVASVGLWLLPTAALMAVGTGRTHGRAPN